MTTTTGQHVLSPDEYVTLPDFRRTKGTLWAAVSLDNETSEWVRVSKVSLIETLKALGYTHARIAMDGPGDILYLGARRGGSS